MRTLGALGFAAEAALHHRQARVLTLEQGLEWLRLDGSGKALLEDPEPVGGFVMHERPRDLEAA
jgi:putative SOS response-associated peptidase YedK